METFISYCGLMCQGCPIFWATAEKNEDKKRKMKTVIAKMSNDHYKTNFGPENIVDCDGCKTENGRLFAGCYDCQIRNCAKSKNISSCASCEEYSCDKLDQFFKENPESKIRLDIIKSILELN